MTRLFLTKLSVRLLRLVLRSDRPYRARWSTERARQHIRKQAGRQFDPHVVEVFHRMLRADAGYAAGASG